MKTLLPLLFLTTWLYAQDEGAYKYDVQRIGREIEIDGKGSDPLWEKALILTNFHLPWNEEIAQPTTFQALWSDYSLYFFYRVIDHDIIAPGSGLDERGVLPSDRIEIFFRQDSTMNPYYCLEMDPKGRVLDYDARYYREFDIEWDWPENGIEVRTAGFESGYTVEGKISMASLRELSLVDDDGILEVGLFRGDFYHQEDRTVVRWITWVPPDVSKPDFHVPSAFGIIELVK